MIEWERGVSFWGLEVYRGLSAVPPRGAYVVCAVHVTFNKDGRAVWRAGNWRPVPAGASVPEALDGAELEWASRLLSAAERQRYDIDLAGLSARFVESIEPLCSAELLRELARHGRILPRLAVRLLSNQRLDSAALDPGVFQAWVAKGEPAEVQELLRMDLVQGLSLSAQRADVLIAQPHDPDLARWLRTQRAAVWPEAASVVRAKS